MKIQNGGWIQDDVKNVYIFHPILSKMIIYNFLFYLGKNKTFMEKLLF
jgi:hypothetical protein